MHCYTMNTIHLPISIRNDALLHNVTVTQCHCYTMNTRHLPVFSLHDLFDNNGQDISGIIAVLDVHTKLYYEPAGGTKW